MKKKVKQKALPTGWREVRLNNVASVKTGPFGAQLHQHDYVQSNGTPIITVEHLSERGLIHKNLPLVSDHDKERLNQYLIQEGDIVFSRVGSVDRSTLVSKDEDGWLFSGRLLRVRPKKSDVHGSYLNYFFHAQKFRHHMQSIAVGGTMPSINTSILSNVIIHLPPMNEQKAIASLLETWDTAIEKTEALIAAKEKQLKWLLKTLISDQQDNPEWRKVKLGEVGVISSAGVDKKTVEEENPVRLVNYLDVLRKNFISSNDLDHWVTAPERKMIQCDVRKGDIFFTPSSEIQGDIAHSAVAVEDIGKAVYSYHIVRFRLNENWDTIFRAYVFKALRFYRQAYRMCEGSGQRYVISQNYFKNMTICVPKPKEQRKIAQTLHTVQREADLLKQLAEKHHTQKRGLMQKLLMGKWTVKI